MCVTRSDAPASLAHGATANGVEPATASFAEVIEVQIEILATLLPVAS